MLGAVLREPDRRPKTLSNSAVVLAGGRRIGARAKSLLPTYDVFDEKRYFAAGTSREPVIVEGLDARLGLAVCEDTWSDQVPYGFDPVSELASAGVSRM